MSDDALNEVRALRKEVAELRKLIAARTALAVDATTAAALLGVSRPTLYDLERLPRTQYPGITKTLYPVAALEKYIADHQTNDE